MSSKVDGIHDTLVGNIDVKIGEMHNLVMAMNTPATSPLLSPGPRRDTLISLTDTLVPEPARAESAVSDRNAELVNSNSSSSTAGPSLNLKDEERPGWRTNKRSSSSPNSSRSHSRKSGATSPSSTPYGTPPTVFEYSQPALDQDETSHNRPKASKIPALDLPQPVIAASAVSANVALPSSTVTRSQPTKNFGPAFLANDVDFMENSYQMPKATTASQHENFEHAVFDNAVVLCKG